MEGIGQDVIREGQGPILRDIKRVTAAKIISIQEANLIDAHSNSIAVEASHQLGPLARAVEQLGHRRVATVMQGISSISLASF